MPPRKPFDPVPAPPPHRPSVSEIALALAQRPKSDPVQTVKLARISSGEVTIGVDVNDASVTTAAKVASDTFDVLCAKYPRSNGG
jgi:hypothetical protein